MDFNSLVYLGFFCAVAAVNYLLPKAARPWLLLVASYAFYLYDPRNAQLVALLLSATLITWACGLALERLTNPWVRRLFLCLSFLTCMGVLFFYKYYDFFGEALLGSHFTPLKLAAPLGLSYFTFASLGYAVDQYQGKYPPEKNLFRYALFVSFFPAIVTGPIEQGDHLLPQLKAPRPFDYDRCAGGLFRMLWGYVKTMVIAEAVSPYVRQVYSHPADYAGPYLAAAAVLFSLYLYMNFSGCCDLAIGSARILGYDLLENFESPFLSPTFRELWRRWHMSLTGWFRRYLYVPLGGSRKGLFRHCMNLLLVFLFSGLWHGADWGYLWWGLASGLLSVAGLLFDKALKRPKNPQPLPLPLRVLQVLRTYLLFSLVFVFFACALYGSSPAVMFAGMFKDWSGALPGLASGFVAAGLDAASARVALIGAAFVFACEALGNVSQWVRKLPFWVRWPLYYLLCLSILFFGAFGQSAYIYQQY